MGGVMLFDELGLHDLFVIPNDRLNGEVAVLAKTGPFSAQAIRGPDHHGRIIYESEKIEVPESLQVQKINKQCIRDYMS